MKILIASPIDPEAVSTLDRDHEVVHASNAPDDVLRAALRDREILIFRSGVNISSGVLQDAAGLRLLIRAGSGLDNVDVDCARRMGLRLVRIPGSSAQPVAELTFGLLLAVARKVSLADRWIREGHWPKSELRGPLLHGKTLGIVGAGDIGGRVGQMAAAWGMRAIGCVEHPSPEQALRLRGLDIELADFDTVVAEADFLCLHVPLQDSTRYMIDEAVLARVKTGSFLVNMARGGVVDEAALERALARGDRLAGAALDVHEREGEGTVPPLASMPNVVLTPHIGAMAVDAQREIGTRMLEIVDAYTRGQLDRTLTEIEHVI